MDVTLPNGVVIRGIPEGTSKEQIRQKAISAGLAEESDFSQGGAKNLSAWEAITGAGSALTGGLTLNFADEAGAAVAAALGGLDPRINDQSFGERYQGMLKEARQNDARFSERAPWWAAGLNTAGAVGTGAAGIAKFGAKQVAKGGINLATRKAGTQYSLGRIGAAAGAEGALAGVGAGETLAERVQGGVIGGGTGTALGVAVPGAAGLAGRWIARDKAGYELAKNLPRGGGARGTMLADEVPDLARTVATMPGIASGPKGMAKVALDARQYGQAGRIEEGLQKAMGQSGNALDTLETIVAKRRALAAPTYEYAYKQPVEVTPALSRISERLDAAGAFREGDRLAKIDGREVVGGLERFDYAKRAIDDLIATARRQEGSGNKIGVYTRLKNDLVTELDIQVPEYKKARAAFAGDSALINALEDGANFMKKGRVDEGRRLLFNMSESEREVFKIGALDDLRRVLEGASDTSDKFKRIFDKPVFRERLKLIFGDDAKFDEFAELMQKEADMYRTRNYITGGSNTADKLAAQKEFMSEDGVNILYSYFFGGDFGPGMLRQGANALAQRVRGTRNEAVRNQLSPMLFSTDPNARVQALRRAANALPEFSASPKAAYTAPAVNALALNASEKNILSSP